jgi:hypothetical protein
MTYTRHTKVCQLESGRWVFKRFRTGELAIEDGGLRELTDRELEEFYADENARLDAEDRLSDYAKDIARTVKW